MYINKSIKKKCIYIYSIFGTITIILVRFSETNPKQRVDFSDDV